jgi:hypothetical protein
MPILNSSKMLVMPSPYPLDAALLDAAVTDAADPRLPVPCYPFGSASGAWPGHPQFGVS